MHNKLSTNTSKMHIGNKDRQHIQISRQTQGERCISTNTRFKMHTILGNKDRHHIQISRQTPGVRCIPINYFLPVFLVIPDLEGRDMHLLG
jgi:hypothetical protein